MVDLDSMSFDELRAATIDSWHKISPEDRVMLKLLGIDGDAKR
jgi:hypothetical protein